MKHQKITVYEYCILGDYEGLIMRSYLIIQDEWVPISAFIGTLEEIPLALDWLSRA